MLRASIPWRTLAIAAAALVVAAMPGLGPALTLESGAVRAGEPWRLLTGHLVHGSGYHLLWNVLALIVLGLLFERTLGGRLWALLGLSAVGVSCGLLALDPTLPSYVGLSGLLNGFFVGGALLAARKERRQGNRALEVLYHAVVIGDLIKIGLEARTGAPVFTDSAALGGSPVPLAHALGSLAAMLWLAGHDWHRALARISHRAAPSLQVKPTVKLPCVEVTSKVSSRSSETSTRTAARLLLPKKKRDPAAAWNAGPSSSRPTPRIGVKSSTATRPTPATT
jgi:rhomboid family GlyGly-CTERM serine protease